MVCTNKSFHPLARDLRDECFVSISVEVFCFQHWQQEFCENSILSYFCESSYSQMQRRLQPWWLFGRWRLSSVLQVKISYPLHCVTYFIRRILQISTGECDLKEFTNKQNKKSDLILENNIFNLLKLIRNPHLLDAREALLWKFQLIFLALHAIICAIIHAKGSIINTGTIT